MKTEQRKKFKFDLSIASVKTLENMLLRTDFERYDRELNINKVFINHTSNVPTVSFEVSFTEKDRVYTYKDIKPFTSGSIVNIINQYNKTRFKQERDLKDIHPGCIRSFNLNNIFIDREFCLVFASYNIQNCYVSKTIKTSEGNIIERNLHKWYYKCILKHFNDIDELYDKFQKYYYLDLDPKKRKEIIYDC